MSDEQVAREIADSVAGYIAEPRRTELADDIATALRTQSVADLKEIDRLKRLLGGECPECRGGGEVSKDGRYPKLCTKCGGTGLAGGCWRADLEAARDEIALLTAASDRAVTYAENIKAQAATDKATIERLTRERDEALNDKGILHQMAAEKLARAEAAEAQVAALAGEVEALVEAANALLDGREGAVANLQRCIDATLSTTAPEPCGGIGDDITLDPVRLLSDDLRNEEA